jgi:hypothetical protein
VFDLILRRQFQNFPYALRTPRFRVTVRALLIPGIFRTGSNVTLLRLDRGRVAHSEAIQVDGFPRPAFFAGCACLVSI